MKNFIIVILAVCLAISLSFIYKIERKMPLHLFPISDLPLQHEIENPFFLVIFFSIQNCKDCLGMIDILNNLTAPFIVYGIVPPPDIKNEQELRRVTGATFKLLSGEKFINYAPIYAPTLFGVSQKGRILFILPGIPGQKEYLEHFLINLYNKAYAVIMH